MNKNYWPHFIIALVTFAILLGIWTVKMAINNPVQLDESYMMKYQDVDKNYYKIEQERKSFHARYTVIPLTEKLQFPKTEFRFKIVCKNGNPVPGADVVVLFTRPDTSKYDIKTKATYENGTYVAKATLPLEGRWNVQLKITLNNLTDYEQYKLSTRRIIQNKLKNN